MSVERSSFCNSYGGENKSKFTFGGHRQSSTITENQLFAWTSGNMYRTSYNEMANKVSLIYNPYVFNRANQLSERTVSFLNIRVTFQILKRTNCCLKDILNNLEMFLRNHILMRLHRPWLPQALTKFTFLRVMILSIPLQEDMEQKPNLLLTQLFMYQLITQQMKQLSELLLSTQRDTQVEFTEQEILKQPCQRREPSSLNPM